MHLLTKVSTLYYVGQQTQQEIADRLRLSRPRVSRLLAEALERGIVQISIAPPTGLYTDLETRLEA
jgi:DNA-binding transcriptional regulator LsrR (DeoR family)